MSSKPRNKPTEQAAAEVKEQLPAVAASTAVGTVIDYGDDFGKGHENSDARDLKIPFLTILADVSDQVKQKLPGCEPGKLINTITWQLWDGDGSCVVLPVFKNRVYVEWIPRKQGGGLVGMHAPDSEIVLKLLKQHNNRPQGPMAYKTELDPRSTTGERKVMSELVETLYMYVLILDPTGIEAIGSAMIAFKSKGLSPYREWNTVMDGLRVSMPQADGSILKKQPPLFANRARAHTFLDTSKAGDTFYNWRFAPLAEDWNASLLKPSVPQERELILQAKALMAKVELAGHDPAQAEAAAGVADHGTTSTSGNMDDMPDEEAPF